MNDDMDRSTEVVFTHFYHSLSPPRLMFLSRNASRHLCGRVLFIRKVQRNSESYTDKVSSLTTLSLLHKPVTFHTHLLRNFLSTRVTRRFLTPLCAPLSPLGVHETKVLSSQTLQHHTISGSI